MAELCKKYGFMNTKYLVIYFTFIITIGILVFLEIEIIIPHIIIMSIILVGLHTFGLDNLTLPVVSSMTIFHINLKIILKILINPMLLEILKKESLRLFL